MGWSLRVREPACLWNIMEIKHVTIRVKSKQVNEDNVISQRSEDSPFQLEKKRTASSRLQEAILHIPLLENNVQTHKLFSEWRWVLGHWFNSCGDVAGVYPKAPYQPSKPVVISRSSKEFSAPIGLLSPSAMPPSNQPSEKLMNVMNNFSWGTNAHPKTQNMLQTTSVASRV